MRIEQCEAQACPGLSFRHHLSVSRCGDTTKLPSTATAAVSGSSSGSPSSIDLSSPTVTSTSFTSPRHLEIASTTGLLRHP